MFFTAFYRHRGSRNSPAARARRFIEHLWPAPSPGCESLTLCEPDAGGKRWERDCLLRWCVPGGRLLVAGRVQRGARPDVYMTVRDSATTLRAATVRSGPRPNAPQTALSRLLHDRPRSFRKIWICRRGPPRANLTATARAPPPRRSGQQPLVRRQAPAERDRRRADRGERAGHPAGGCPGQPRSGALFRPPVAQCAG